MEQGKQTYNGTVLFRWYVTVDRAKAKTIVTWAENEAEARGKAEARGLRVVRVDPAQHRI